MAIDRSFSERNRAATERIRRLGNLDDTALLTRVGEDWTVAVVLAHLAFWDRKILIMLDRTEQDGKLYAPAIDVIVNDLALPLWAAIPPHEAVRLALEAAETLDRRLEEYPERWLERVYVNNPRWVERYQHRNAHLDEAEAALKGLQDPRSPKSL
ncbi:mycothiol maleylpyruvate isomerase N-terminal domain [Longilinea arvoryzae]|uniref:Mycothiol maleylpyruvate isomerase N-terminal domain n=1 Tax=Longilinea arvoryzae TaxID=360412 RepID=A0A0K8MY33_9CHLR|nr:maleylpyruvate isomerase N-terminal domain-containing protein [Longilinea arvoryzae]GAP15916.1 mycothiol maleylpyruvate isomerase N-terminal domain [Longilinea arvoryzae]